jgi:hypothetical protein
VKSRYAAAALVVGIVILNTGTARAFDGRRSGFILGFGLGGGYTHVTQTLSSSLLSGDESVTADEFGVASEFKIGAGIGNRFQLYYANRMNWFSVEGGSVTFTSAVGLVGVSYYLEEQTPSLYLMGLIGLSSWDAPFEEGVDSSSGFGIGAGLGWEFARHFSFEATVNWGNPSTDEGGFSLDTEFTTVLLTLNAIAY